MALSPLFDLYDPQGLLQDDLGLGIPQTEEEILGLVPIRKRKPQVADLLPEEEKTTLLRQLANAGSSGLSGFGWLLDMPGAMVRGLLSEGPGKALSAVWEDSEQRVTGRELARQYGLAGSEDNWSNFAGGLAAEIALDPLSYLGIGLLGRGAKTAAAKVAEKAGLMTGDIGLLARRKNAGTAEFLRNSTPQTLIDMADDPAKALADWGTYGGTAEQLSQPLTRMNRVSVPGLMDGAVDLFGKGVGDWAARTSDRVGGWARSAPVLGPAIRHAQAMFDPRVMGFTDEHGQWIGRELTEGERVAKQTQMQRVADAYVDAGLDLPAGIDMRSPDFDGAFSSFMEGQAAGGITRGTPLGAGLRQRYQPIWDVLANDPAGQKLVQFARSELDDRLARAQQLGIPLEYEKLPAGIEYFPRQAAQIDRPTYARGYLPKQVRARRGTAIAGVGDGAMSSRTDYNRSFPRWVLDAMAQDDTLQTALRNAPNDLQPFAAGGVEDVLESWLRANATNYSNPFDWARQNLPAAAGDARVQKLYTDLADSLRRTPLEAAAKGGRPGIPKYGNSLNDLRNNLMHRATKEAHADTLLKILADKDGLLAQSGDLIRQAAGDVPGGVGVGAAEAMRMLGFDAVGGAAALADRMGVSVDDLADISFSRELIDRLNQRISTSRAPAEATGLLGLGRAFTDTFKTLALASPARHVRDAYSGAFASAARGAFSPLDWAAGARAGGGDYAAIVQRLRGTAQYPDHFTDQQILRKFLKESGGQGLSMGTVADDLGRGASNLQYEAPYPGGSGGLFRNVFNKPLLSARTWWPFMTRGRSSNPNMLLDLSDRAASFTDAGNRIGTFVNRIRKGDSPAAAKGLTDLTQVLYGPENFTSFERDVLTNLFPFYRFTKGITPFVADELVNRPYGLTGQSLRAVNRGSEPSEDQFTPEYLRQSAAIPIDADSLFGVKTPGVQRFLTNIDLPHESLLNLFTPGIGNTFGRRLADSLMKTGSNILGQSNPILKGPLESVLNRQFYSGRQLSDLYSMLEHDLGSLSPYLGPYGRMAEQIAVNLPGGSRALGLMRQVRDERISPSERAAKLLFNALTGMKFQDVDQDKTLRLAARTTLNELLDAAPGVSTYENLFIKPEDLAQLSEPEQRQYLLYRVLQSEAAKRAREKKKQSEDPLAVLGVQY
jgi:hypothetical protein